MNRQYYSYGYVYLIISCLSTGDFSLIACGKEGLLLFLLVWLEEPQSFNLNPRHHKVGLNISYHYPHLRRGWLNYVYDIICST